MMMSKRKVQVDSRLFDVDETTGEVVGEKKVPPPCLHGAPLDEAMSSLQKAVRRSDGSADAVAEVLYWASEMDRSGYGAVAWNRMLVICSEDIGMAGRPGLPSDLRALYQNWLDAQKRKRGSG